jgi:hypothetical protein
MIAFRRFCQKNQVPSALLRRPKRYLRFANLGRRDGGRGFQHLARLRTHYSAGYAERECRDSLTEKTVPKRQDVRSIAREASAAGRLRRNRITGKVGPSTNMSDYPTYQALCRPKGAKLRRLLVEQFASGGFSRGIIRGGCQTPGKARQACKPRHF